MCYRNTDANINTSQHKGCVPLKCNGTTHISVLFLNSKHRNPYELSQLGQTVSVPEEKVRKRDVCEYIRNEIIW